MQVSKLFLKTLFFITISLSFSGCSPLNLVASTGATAGSIALSDAGFDVGISDTETNISISKKLAQNTSQYFTEVDVEVHEGRVLLTGIVQSEDMRINASKIAWEVPAVQEVVNKIIVGEKLTLAQKAKDSLTYTKLLAKLTFDKSINAVNYKISVINNHVYIMGIAQNRTEIDLIIGQIRSAEGVVNFTTDILLIDDPRRAETLKALRSYIERKKQEKSGIKPRNSQQNAPKNIAKTPITTKPANPQKTGEKLSMKKIVIANPK